MPRLAVAEWTAELLIYVLCVGIISRNDHHLFSRVLQSVERIEKGTKDNSTTMTSQQPQTARIRMDKSIVLSQAPKLWMKLQLHEKEFNQSVTKHSRWTCKMVKIYVQLSKHTFTSCFINYKILMLVFEVGSLVDSH